MSDIAASGADTRPRVVAGLRLLARVGSGGEGEVWEARDPDGRRCALKLIRPEVLPAADELARRGAYLCRIRHPALVRVHRTGLLRGSSLEGWGFLEMEFVEGEPLGSAPADPSALERLEPLAQGLDALHRGEWSDGVPLVHRDVKPANLISRPGGDVVLVDCSTLRGTDATQLTRVGTPVFAAPEVVTGLAGPPADVYSFGATIVALVTGARGPELARLIAEPERLDLPDAVRRALLADSAGRPRSCEAVLDAGTEIDLDLLPALPSRHDWFDEEGAEGPAGLDAGAPGDVGGRADGGAPAGVGAPATGLRPAEPGAWPGTPPVDPPAVTPWLIVLLACCALAFAATAGRAGTSSLLAAAGLDVPPRVWAPGVAFGAALLHVLAVRGGGQPWVTTLLAPPVAWAWLLGERVTPPGTRRAWARTTMTGLLTFAGVAGAASVAGIDVSGEAAGLPWSSPRLAGVSLALVALVPLAGRARGLGGLLLRAALAPAWAVGAALLLVGAACALATLGLLGRGRPAAALAAGTLAGSGAFLGLPGRFRGRQTPDPRA